MAVQYSIEYVNSTVEVRASGIPDRASLTQMWKDIIAACKEHHCFSILGIANMDRPLSLADAIDHQAIFPEAGVTIDHRIAWVQESMVACLRTSSRHAAGWQIHSRNKNITLVFLSTPVQLNRQIS
jgi:hypothetical protein